MFGTDKLTAFQDAGNVEKLIDRFLARAQIEAGVERHLARAPGR